MDDRNENDGDYKADRRIGVVLRRGFRFGLRALLLFVVASAVVCSWFAMRMHRARKQREAVEAILKTGACVGYDY